MKNPLLSVQGLRVRARRDGIEREVIQGLALEIAEGQVVGLAGESGSGKSMLGAAIGGLLPPGCEAVAGQVLWRGEDLLAAPTARLERLRGKEIAYIFQEPMTALNPTLRIGRQLGDVIRAHGDAVSARELALKLLADVRIDEPQAVFDAWPHQLSGGMRQRVLIAMAFSCRPALIVADEPTTALDVTVQAQVLALLLALSREHRTAVLLITHDIGVARRACERVNVMYAGRIVEQGAVRDVLDRPRHPYTRGLLDCLPERAAPRQPLRALPQAGANLPGCVFRNRCAFAVDRCAEAPELRAAAASDHRAACWLDMGAEVSR